MILIHNIILLLFYCVTNTWAQSQVDLESDHLYEDDYDLTLLENNDVYLPVSKNNLRGQDYVKIQVYYESMSLSSIDFYRNELKPVAFFLSGYVEIETYPFGNAKIIEKNDEVEFECEHGPDECYGNKLHACVLDKLWPMRALEYNSCLMNMELNSNDEAANWCGKTMGLTRATEDIKRCAKGTKGTQLLLYYGELSKREKFSYVPHVLINGKMYDDFNFLENVCKAFTKPPRHCQYHM